jgi:hypothetical protein
MMPTPSRTNPATQRWLILALTLIAVSTALFVAGVAIERGLAAPPASTQQGQEGQQGQQGQVADAGATPPGDGDGGHEDPSSPGKGAHGSAGTETETVLGLDLENPWVVGLVVAVWLGVAAALLRFGRLAWVAALGAALVATALHVAEVGRQVAEVHPALVTLAVLVALTHLALVMLAGFVLLRTRQGKILSRNSV